MALSREGIAKVRTSASTISQLVTTDLQSASEELKTKMQTDGNYQLFKVGTDKGYSVDEDLALTLNTIIENLIPSLSEADGLINEFCQVQENLNSMEEERRQRETQQTTNSKSSEIVIPDKVVKHGDSVKGDKLWHYQEKE